VKDRGFRVGYRWRALPAAYCADNGSVIAEHALGFAVLAVVNLLGGTWPPAISASSG